MKISRCKNVVTILVLLFCGPAFAAEASTDAGKIQVNDETIPADEINLLLAERQASGAADKPALEKAVREQLIARELFAQQARKAKLDKTKAFATKLRMAKEEMLAREYQQQYVAQHPPAEADLRSAYAGIRQRAGDTAYHVRQIFVPTEDEAKAVIGRLEKGESFDTLATTLSKDDGSRARGGDLGWLTPLQLQPGVIPVVTALKKGEFTHAPVKGQNGWHVIRVDNTRPFAPPTYEQLLPQLQQELSRRMLQAHLLALRKRATVR